MQVAVYSRMQVERCLRWAFDYTRKYGKKARGVGDKNTLALVGKTNVLTYVYDLWERAFHEIGARDYPTSRVITTTSMPAACGWSRAQSGSMCS